MLSQKFRLNKDFEIRRVWRFGKKLETDFASLRFVRIFDQPFSRFAFVASKKIGNAVVRHRTLRLLREAVRQKMEMLRGNFWAVVTAKKSLTEKKLNDVLPQIEFLLGKMNSLNNV